MIETAYKLTPFEPTQMNRFEPVSNEVFEIAYELTPFEPAQTIRFEPVSNGEEVPEILTTKINDVDGIWNPL